ncbi:MAG: threonine aldolase [Patiriisocius sp.]|jgi:threonine aldolase
MIDFRSDTLTKPTPQMLDFMMKAEVGDDVFGEDPNINAIESKLAILFGKEAGLFCPSGTMCNQIAIKVHTQPGDEVICSDLSHVYHYEGGGMAMNSGVTSKLISGDRGRFSVKDLLNQINPDDVHKANTSLVCIEDTMNKGGGAIWDPLNIKAIAKFCQNNNLSFHLDGARVFNAIAETGVSEKEYGSNFDSISICLSKGLGAPIGSVLLGSKLFVHKARRVRKVFGGAMRQAGYLAAAGIYALDNHRDRLQEDHRRAKEAGSQLKSLPRVESVLPVETNIVIFDLAISENVDSFIAMLEETGVMAIGMGGQSIRIVYHLDISESDHIKFLEILKGL